MHLLAYMISNGMLLFLYKHNLNSATLQNALMKSSFLQIKQLRSQGIQSEKMFEHLVQGLNK